jgi:hypothetical protein
VIIVCGGANRKWQQRRAHAKFVRAGRGAPRVRLSESAAGAACSKSPFIRTHTCARTLHARVLACWQNARRGECDECFLGPTGGVGTLACVLCVRVRADSPGLVSERSNVIGRDQCKRCAPFRREQVRRPAAGGEYLKKKRLGAPRLPQRTLPSFEEERWQNRDGDGDAEGGVCACVCVRERQNGGSRASKDRVLCTVSHLAAPGWPPGHSAAAAAAAAAAATA